MNKYVVSMFILYVYIDIKHRVPNFIKSFLVGQVTYLFVQYFSGVNISVFLRSQYFTKMTVQL